MAKSRVSPEFLQKIKDAVNLVEVVGEHVVLRKTGANHVGLCPFHQERSPSFSVSENKQLYHCYGCKRGGDLVQFVMELHGLSFPEAIEELAERGRVKLPDNWGGSAEDEKDPEAAQRRAAAREKITLAHKVNRFVAAYYHQLLPRQPHIDQYFAQRGLTGDWLRNFYVGAAPASWDMLSAHLVAKQAPLPVAVELGLIRPSQKGGRPGGPGYFDMFRNRAMFPIMDLRGKVAGFGGRMLPLPPGAPDVAGEKPPKYMNSPDSVVFQKGKLAFGLYQAQKHIREKDEVILVEGYFDVTALHIGGFQNAVAACGTNLTVDHLHIFKRLGSRMTLLFDGDEAGITAMDRAMETALDQGVILYGAVVPGGKDPDEILLDQQTGRAIPQGVERMQEVLASARPLLDARIDEAIRAAADGPEAVSQALKQIASWLARYKDPIGREIRVENVVQKLGVSRSLLEKAMGGGQVRGRGGAQEIRTVSQPQQSPPGPPGPSPMYPPMHDEPPFDPGYGPPEESGYGDGFGDGGFGGQDFGRRRDQRQYGDRKNWRDGSNNSRRQGKWNKDGRRDAPRGAPGLGPRRSKNEPSPRDKILLQALTKGGRAAELFQEAGGKLPSHMNLGDLFDSPPARHFAAQLCSEPGGLENFRANPASLFGLEVDEQVRSIVTEASMKDELPVEESEVRFALDRGVARAWACFSQQIKKALADAEAKKDAGLQSKLMKEYLDVQRKMKEFSSFYDEAQG